jgi:uncharacterized protein (DUF302 family)
MQLLRLWAGLTVMSLLATAAFAAGPEQTRSQRSFDETVQHLQWAFGGFGVTTVTALDYQQILKKVRVDTGRAAMFEIMRREWLKTLLQADPSLGLSMPVRVYVFEQSDGATIVTYQRPGALTETSDNETVRALGRKLDEKLRLLVTQATTHAAQSGAQDAEPSSMR